MPRDIVSVAVVRPGAGMARDGSGGYTRAGSPVAVSGSPFQCRVFRKPQAMVTRDEAAPSVATVDQVIVLSFQDITAPVAINDIATLPGGIAAKILRIRRYKRTLQCDMETGAE